MTSFLGVISIVCILIAAILLLNLISSAFEMEGFQGLVWGFISILFPIGTYYYCRRDWDIHRTTFFTITGLVIVSVVFWLIVHLFGQA